MPVFRCRLDYNLLQLWRSTIDSLVGTSMCIIRVREGRNDVSPVAYKFTATLQGGDSSTFLSSILPIIGFWFSWLATSSALQLPPTNRYTKAPLLSKGCQFTL